MLATGQAGDHGPQDEIHQTEGLKLHWRSVAGPGQRNTDWGDGSFQSRYGQVHSTWWCRIRNKIPQWLKEGTRRRRVCPWWWIRKANHWKWPFYQKQSPDLMSSHYRFQGHPSKTEKQSKGAHGLAFLSFCFYSWLLKLRGRPRHCNSVSFAFPLILKPWFHFEWNMGFVAVQGRHMTENTQWS